MDMVEKVARSPSPMTIPNEIMQAATVVLVEAIHESEGPADGSSERAARVIARAIMAAEGRQREKADRLERKVAARDRRITRLVEALDYARAQGVRFPADDEPRRGDGKSLPRQS